MGFGRVFGFPLLALAACLGEQRERSPTREGPPDTLYLIHALRAEAAARLDRLDALINALARTREAGTPEGGFEIAALREQHAGLAIRIGGISWRSEGEWTASQAGIREALDALHRSVTRARLSGLAADLPPASLRTGRRID